MPGKTVKLLLNQGVRGPQGTSESPTCTCLGNVDIIEKKYFFKLLKILIVTHFSTNVKHLESFYAMFVH